MDLTQIEALIKAALAEVADQMKAQNFDTSLALAELVETLANARQGMK